MFKKSMALVALLFVSMSGSGATLVVSGGRLTGATGVDVGGTLYNVEFLRWHLF